MTDQGPDAPNSAAGAPQRPPASPAWEPPIDSGSQVVVVVSRGVSPAPVAPPAAVPDVLGKAQGEALAKLQEVSLGAQVFNDNNPTVPRGKVIGQLPESGLAAPQGMAVILMVSNGPTATAVPQVGLPDVIGMNEAEAVAKLQSAGLTPHIVREFSPKVPEGVVMATLPNAHSLAAAPPKRSLLWLWILLAVLALLLLGGLWYVNQQPDGVNGLWFFGVSSAPTSTVEATVTVEETAPAEPAVTTAKVPDVVGMSQKDAEAALEDAGFTALATKVTTNDTPAGDVVAQVPAADTELTKGSQVALQVAQAAEPPKPTTVTVPNVKGMTQANAQSALVKAGLAPSFVNQANEAPKGQAFDQQPLGGQEVAPETVVVVAISTGPATTPEPTTVSVPAVIGKTQADAQTALTNAKLTSQVVQSYSTTVAKGIVIQQWPPAGNKVAPGTPVALVVSMGPKPSSGTATVPNVKGMDSAGATQALADVGLIAQAVTISDPQATEGDVVGQLPAAGSTVPAGSTVLIGVAGPGATQLPTTP
jgi:beta-lactam-binding protein with PASTA domain